MTAAGILYYRQRILHHFRLTMAFLAAVISARPIRFYLIRGASQFSGVFDGHVPDNNFCFFVWCTIAFGANVLVAGGAGGAAEVELSE